LQLWMVASKGSTKIDPDKNDEEVSVGVGC
jgi:hypothetical protein